MLDLMRCYREDRIVLPGWSLNGLGVVTRDADLPEDPDLSLSRLHMCPRYYTSVQLVCPHVTSDEVK